jgi:hypothetical protein
MIAAVAALVAYQTGLTTTARPRSSRPAISAASLITRRCMTSEPKTGLPLAKSTVLRRRSSNCGNARSSRPATSLRESFDRAGVQTQRVMT